MIGEVMFPSISLFAMNWRYATEAGNLIYDFCWRADLKVRASPASISRSDRAGEGDRIMTNPR
jgi:hypothetical protein